MLAHVVSSAREPPALNLCSMCTLSVLHDSRLRLPAGCRRRFWIMYRAYYDGAGLLVMFLPGTHLPHDAVPHVDVLMHCAVVP